MTTTISADKRTETTITYTREFRWRDDPSAGFAFDVDERGNYTSKNPCADANYQKCIDGTYDVFDLGVKTNVRTVRLCSCGSGLWPEAVYDARGIYVCKACPKCKKEKTRGYRPEIFTDPGYDTFGERVEEDGAE